MRMMMFQKTTNNGMTFNFYQTENTIFTFNDNKKIQFEWSAK